MADLRRLPNLTALRAFEAAARHENFSRAAEEIHVTHGAISHQVRALEDELGLELFTRRGKRLSVTAEGERFAIAVRKALTDIALAADALKATGKQKRVTITSLPSFAARCLAPRLGQFIEQYPDVEVALQSNSHMVDFTREDVDVGVRFGYGHYPGLHTELLMHDYYYPVASPAFNGGRLPATVSELAATELLRTAGEPWAPWFAAAGVADFPEPRSRLTFFDSSLPVRAALDGEGIALVRHSLVARDVREGRLVRLFDAALDCEFSYYFVCLPASLQKPAIQAFRTWLFDEFRGLDDIEAATTQVA
jgi:LysR family transcriptional regulator, glycine cleavage system transcriptional activator